jgi:hypothetical protein
MMSSETSIDHGRLKPAPTIAVAPTTAVAPTIAVEAGFSRPDDGRPEDGFQAWHFFVLASILLATVAVVLARRSSPEHLILLSVAIASAGAVGAGLYRMLVPLVSPARVFADAPLTGRRRGALERDKMLVLRSIKELEFDRAMGKLSQKDFDEMAGRLRQRAVSLMRQLDAGAGYGEVIERELNERMGRLTAQTACSCGTVNDNDAVFCKKCGSRLQAA